MASIRIFPFDARDAVEKKGGGNQILISSVLELIQFLRASEGNPDKPVRLLHDDTTGVTLVAKFGFGEDLQRQPCIQDELENQQTLVATKMPKPHIALMQWGGSAIENNNDRPSCVVCTEYIKPLGSIHTLRQLASKGTDEVWRQALFQTIWNLFALQTFFPGYRHNDLKADNVLISDPSDKHASYSIESRNGLRRVWQMPLKVWAKIIDFELSCTPDSNGFKSRAVKNGHGGVLESVYGLSPYRCDCFDIHLLFFDALSSSTNNVSVHANFAAFVHSFFSPGLFRVENLTKQCRLSLKDQEGLQENLGSDILLKMLAHPYFYFLRGSSSDTADYDLFL